MDELQRVTRLANDGDFEIAFQSGKYWVTVCGFMYSGSTLEAAINAAESHQQWLTEAKPETA